MEIVMEGLDGAVSLDFLSALGLLRTIAVAHPDAKLSWRQDRKAILHLAGEHLVGDVFSRAGEVLSQLCVVNDTKSLAESDEWGVAHLGSEALSVNPDVFRRKAKAAISALGDPDVARRERAKVALAVMGGQGCDGVLNEQRGRLQVGTTFCFSNGGGRQNLLGDWQKLASEFLALGDSRSKGDALRRHFVVGVPVGAVSKTLNWEPQSLQNYAIRWDYERSRTYSDPWKNLVALLGLGFYPVMPSGKTGELVTVGWERIGKNWAWTWPLWVDPIGCDSIKGVLSCGGLADQSVGRNGLWEAMGFSRVYRCERWNNPKGRLYLMPSELVWRS